MGFTREVRKAGAGARPVRGQTVTVKCTGYVAESGKKFWSTDDTGLFSFQIGMGKVIRAWDEGVSEMQLGESSRLTATHDYAYGAAGFPSWGIPPSATLIFDVELVKIE